MVQPNQFEEAILDAAIMKGPPKDEWRLEKERHAEADETKPGG